MQRSREPAGQAEDAAWAAARRAAEAIAPAIPWRQTLADRVQAAVGEHHTLVFTCPLGRPERGRFASSPAEYGPLNEIIMTEYFPRLHRSGEGWPRLYHRLGPIVFPVLETLAHLPVVQALRNDLLAPLGVVGYLCAFLVAPTEELAGWFALGTRRAESEVLAEVAGPLREVSALATRTLAATFDLAESCGAAFPDGPAAEELLSAREGEVAALVASGLSDLNIAARLSIRETTVGSHLHRIYKKLGVHSRVELASRWRGMRRG